MIPSNLVNVKCTKVGQFPPRFGRVAARLWSSTVFGGIFGVEEIENGTIYETTFAIFSSLRSESHVERDFGNN